MHKLSVIFMTDSATTAQYFDQAAPLLEPVVKEAARGEFTVPDLRRLCEQGRAICMLVSDGAGPMFALVFEVVHYPSQSAVNLMALGGERFAEGEAVYGSVFREWCRQAGASVIEASCSPAMARMLRKFGFDVAYQVVRSQV